MQAPEVTETTEIQHQENSGLSETELKDALSSFSYTVKKSQSIKVPDQFKLLTRSNTKSIAKPMGAKENSTSLPKYPPDSINFNNCLTTSPSEWVWFKLEYFMT